MSVPAEIRNQVKEIIWNQADDLNWTNLTIPEKSAQYKLWAEDPVIGQILERYIPYQSVHKYIKDSIMKPYAKSKKPEYTHVLPIFSLSDLSIKQEFIKPLGVRLNDGKIICWGRAVDWKIVLLATFERAKVKPQYTAYGVLLTTANGKYASDIFKNLVIDASKRLGIENIKITNQD